MSGLLRLVQLHFGFFMFEDLMCDRTQLWLAVEHGHLDSFSKTPLLLAAQNGHFNIVRLLVESGADVDHSDMCGKIPLLLAAQNSHFKIVRLLVESGADVDHSDKLWKMPSSKHSSASLWNWLSSDISIPRNFMPKWKNAAQNFFEDVDANFRWFDLSKGANETLKILTAGSFLSPFDDEKLEIEKKQKDIVEKAMDVEAWHKECVRVLPYSKNGHKIVRLFVSCGKSGIPPKLKDAAWEYFGDMNVDLEWFDLYKDASEILKISPLCYPTGTPQRLNDSQIQAINKVIKENLHVLVRHRNITAVQPSLKITNSKQTETPCIMLSVLCKGLIPDGECAFPLTLGSFPVDVVNGFWIRTDDPWIPNEAQKQSEVLYLGASIGVKDEDAAGTLGAIVKGGETFYALSCYHVMRHNTKLEITHPACNDHLNYLNHHLKYYRSQVEEMIKQDNNLTLKSQLSVCTPSGTEELSSTFQELKSVKEAHLDHARKINRLVQASDLHERAFEEGFALPRVIGEYAAGISGNEPMDGEPYYVDAAIAKLTPEEKAALCKSQTAELIGTTCRPNGRCSSNMKASGELCKSGRTTEFTKSGRHVSTGFFSPALYEVNAEKKQLVSILKRVKLCQKCVERSATGQVLESTESSCCHCAKDKATLIDSLWLMNCLCIEKSSFLSEGKEFSTKGDSGAVIFEKDDDDDEDENLSAFGVIFGEHRISHLNFTLASPMAVVLNALSNKISCDLKVVSTYNE